MSAGNLPTRTRSRTLPVACHETTTQNPTETQRKVGTTLLLAFFTAIGVLLTDLGFVVSFGGAVLGSALVFIFPTMMWISKCKKDVKMGRQLKVRRSLKHRGGGGDGYVCPHTHT